MEFLQKLGIDWRLLIAQAVNFLILLFILYKFLYKPVLGMLERRRETIEKSLEDAKRIEEMLSKATLDNEEGIRKARVEAGRILEEASLRSEAMREEKIALTKKDIEKIIEQGKTQLSAERISVLRSLREESAELVALAVESVLKDLPHEKIDKALVAESLKNLKSQK